jgi:hypothetical protein
MLPSHFEADALSSPVQSGSWLFPITHHHHFAPFQVSFSQSDLAHNTMGSWGEGVVVAGGLGGGMVREGLSGWMES